jgi:hypothetical protein
MPAEYQKGDPPPLKPPTDGSVSGYTLVQMIKHWQAWERAQSEIDKHAR